MNADIGGPGDQEKNLYPITALANGRHKTRVERSGSNSLDIVGKVNRDELLMYYKVTVSGDHTPREIRNPVTNVHSGFYEIRSTFLCEVADYSLCADDTLRRNAITRVPINQDFIFHPSGGSAFDTITDPNEC